MPTVLRLALLGIAAFFSLATSAPRYSYPRAFPAWEVRGATDLWVSKSGKEGFGISSTRTDLVAARFMSAGINVEGTVPIRQPDAPIYVGFVFDNERLWNEGIRHGTLEVSFADGSRARYALAHVRRGAHQKLDRYDRPPPPPPPPGSQPMPMVPR